METSHIILIISIICLYLVLTDMRTGTSKETLIEKLKKFLGFNTYASVNHSIVDALYSYSQITTLGISSALSALAYIVPVSDLNLKFFLCKN